MPALAGFRLSSRSLCYKGKKKNPSLQLSPPFLMFNWCGRVQRADASSVFCYGGFFFLERRIALAGIVRLGNGYGWLVLGNKE